MKNLNFALFGFGKFGKHYARILQQLKGVTLKTVITPEAPFLKDEKKILASSIILSNNPEIVWRDASISAVIIAAPPSQHFSLIKGALRAGKNVLVEKPMVISLKEALCVKELLKQHSNCFMVGHIYLYNDYLRFIKSYLQKNAIGKMKHAYFQQLSFGPIRYDVDAIWDMGTHELAILDYLLESAKIKKAQGYLSNILNKGKGDFVSLTLKYENGLLANIIFSWFYPKKVREFTLVGEKSTILFDETLSKEKLKIFQTPYPQKPAKFSNWFDELRNKKPFIPKIKAREPLRNQVEHFINCINNDEVPLTDINHGLRIIKALDFISKRIKK